MIDDDAGLLDDAGVPTDTGTPSDAAVRLDARPAVDAGPVERCRCSATVGGESVRLACGESTCTGGFEYTCRDGLLEVGDACVSNPRPADAPDFTIVMVSGHCRPGRCPPGENHEYLVSVHGTYGPIADVIEAHGYDWVAFGYEDAFYDRGEEGFGFLTLLQDLAWIHDNWIADFDDPTRLIVVAHSHGTVWSHLALDVFEHLGVPLPVDVLVDLDGNSLSWESDLATGGIGDGWKAVIRDYNARTGTEWPFDISDCADYWAVPGVAEPQDQEDLVMDSVAINLEVYNTVNAPNDPDPNHRKDGSRVAIYPFGSARGHNDVVRPESDAMRWVATNIDAAYDW